MGRTLSDTLKEQQKWGLVTKPYVKVELSNRWGGITNLQWSQLYSGEEADRFHAACFPGDGSLIRFRELSLGGDIYWSRIISPGPDSDFSSWSAFGGQAYTQAVCAHGSEVLHFHIGTTGDLYRRESNDNGASWGDFIDMGHIGASQTNYRVAACFKSNGDAIVLFSTGTSLYHCKRTPTAYESYTEAYNDLSYIYEPWWTAQTFTPQTTHTLNYVKLQIARVGSPGNVIISIKATDANGHPTGADLTSTTVNGNNLSTTPTWIFIPLPPITVNLNTRYAIVVRASSATFSNRLHWYHRYASTYPRGNQEWSQNSGGTWASDPDIDQLFEEGKTTWGAIYEWTNTLQNISGVSVFHEGDWNVLITGIKATDIDGIWTCLLGDGYSMPVDTWSPLKDIIERGATEPYEYTAPSLSFPDVFRCFFVERFTQPEAGYRLYWSHSLASAEFISNIWREPVPFNLLAQYGLALNYKGSYAWLTSANKVYRAKISADSTEVTNDVLEIDFRQYPHKRKGYCKIVLDNTAGKYNSFDKLGWEVRISPGYHTGRINGGGTGWDGKGNEWSPGSAYWITDYKFVSPPWYPLRMIYPPGIMGTLVLYTEDPWKMLKRWKARRKYSWAAGSKNLSQMLNFLFARVGLEFSAFSNSTAMLNFYPAFEMKQGYSAYWAVKKILSWVPDVLFFRGHYACIKNPKSTDPPYDTFNSTLGVTNLLFRGRYGTSAWEVNRAQVWGDTFRVERFEWPQIHKVFDRLSRVTTPDYATIGDAVDRANAELRTSEVETGADSWMHCPTHVGLEPYDVIEITDVIAGISAIKRRVLGIRWYWNKKHYHYHQFIDLGAP